MNSKEQVKNIIENFTDEEKLEAISNADTQNLSRNDITKIAEYNLLSNNCMHKSTYYLSLCSIKKYNSEFKYRLKQARKYPSPNDAYRVMIYGIDPMNKVSIGTLVVKSR